MSKLEEQLEDEIEPSSYGEYLYAESLFKTVVDLRMNTPRIPNLKHDLIECSVCHKLIDESDIDMCEFCDEDVCEDCWDKHRCEEYDYD